MLSSDICDISMRHLSSIGLTLHDRPAQYKYGNTIKSIFSDPSAHREVSFISTFLLEVTIAASEYKQAIFNDLYFGSRRVIEQCKNLEYLLKSTAQPAWVLVTAYYAAYFMVNDISKINGKFVMNLNEEDFRGLLSTQPITFQQTVSVESNNPFFVTVEHGGMVGEIKLTLRKSSPKPHQIAWSNFSQITNKLSINDERLSYLTLLKSILSSEDAGWENPSAIRNTWNYSQSNYFDAKGNEIGRTFYSLIGSEKSTFGWARNNNLKPTVENVAASIAFIYHTLRSSHSAIMERLKIA